MKRIKYKQLFFEEIKISPNIYYYNLPHFFLQECLDKNRSDILCYSDKINDFWQNLTFKQKEKNAIHNKHIATNNILELANALDFATLSSILAVNKNINEILENKQVQEILSEHSLEDLKLKLCRNSFINLKNIYEYKLLGTFVNDPFHNACAVNVIKFNKYINEILENKKQVKELKDNISTFKYDVKRNIHTSIKNILKFHPYIYTNEGYMLDILMDNKDVEGILELFKLYPACSEHIELLFWNDNLKPQHVKELLKLYPDSFVNKAYLKIINNTEYIEEFINDQEILEAFPDLKEEIDKNILVNNYSIPIKTEEELEDVMKSDTHISHLKTKWRGVLYSCSL